MKRRLLIAGIFLLAGAILNVAVAWGCALLAGPVPAIRWEGLTPEETAATFDRIAPDDWVMAAEGIGLRLPAVGYSGAHVTTDIVRDGIGMVAGVSEYSFGLPWRSLRLELLFDRPPPPGVARDRVVGGIWLRSSDPWPDNWTGGGVPYVFAWPGFAINTVFYATALWLLICGPFALRRFIRVRRGLCPACAYPVGESAVCTECGRELARRADRSKSL